MDLIGPTDNLYSFLYNEIDCIIIKLPRETHIHSGRNLCSTSVKLSEIAYLTIIPWDFES